MDYEKKYKEALERARELQENSNGMILKKWLWGVFPELKESEDERIRKAIKKALQVRCDGSRIISDEPVTLEEAIVWLEKQSNKSVNIDIESMVSSYEQRLESQGGTKYSPLVNMCLTAFRHGVENALEELNLKKLEKQGENKSDFSNIRIWKYIVDMVLTEKNGIGNYLDNPDTERIAKKLQEKYGNIEKQGEKKPADKIEPKFKVGDWIVFNGLILHIDEIVNGYYRTTSRGDGIHNSYDWDIDNAARLWTIQEAKDGDVLAYVTNEEDLWIMIYRSLYEPYEGHVHYHALLVNDNFSDKGTCCICIDNLKPATKEQRELLFQKMKEEGYEWDSEKKELKKIVPKKLDADKVIEWLRYHIQVDEPKKNGI